MRANTVARAARRLWAGLATMTIVAFLLCTASVHLHHVDAGTTPTVATPSTAAATSSNPAAQRFPVATADRASIVDHDLFHAVSEGLTPDSFSPLTPPASGGSDQPCADACQSSCAAARAPGSSAYASADIDLLLLTTACLHNVTAPPSVLFASAGAPLDRAPTPCLDALSISRT